MIPKDATELQRVTDAVHVALVQAGVTQSDVIVHQEREAPGVHLPPLYVIRINVYAPRWSLQRLWWWWRGQAAFDGVEHRVRHVLSSLDGMAGAAARAGIFIYVDEPPG